MKRGVLWLSQPTPIDSKQLSIIGLGLREVMDPGYVYRPNGMDSYLLMHFHDPVEVQKGERMLKCPANTFILWKPWDLHHFGNLKKNWRHSWLHCYGKVINSIIQGNNRFFGSPITLSDSLAVDTYVSRIYQELISHRHPDVYILECLVTLWLRECYRLFDSMQEQRIPVPFLDIRHYIEERISKSIDVEDLAKMANLSLSHFITKFRYYYGEPPLQFHLSLKLRHAAYLLHDSHFTITHVAEKVGIDDPFYFSKLFRKKFGKSPRQYRKYSANATEEHH